MSEWIFWGDKENEEEYALGSLICSLVGLGFIWENSDYQKEARKQIKKIFILRNKCVKGMNI